MTNPVYDIGEAEKFWLGPSDEKKHLVYQMQNADGKYYMVEDRTMLDPSFSEFSVRISNPSARSLSTINNTIAILPKSQLRTIRNLIDAYIKEVDDYEV